MSCFGCCGGGSARNRAADEYSLRESASRARHRNPQDSPNNMGTGEQSSHQANGAQGVYGGLPRSTSAAGGQDPHSVRHSKSFKTPNVGVYFEGKPEAPLSSLTDAAVGDSREFTDQKRSRRDLKRNVSRATGDVATHGAGTVRESVEDRDATDNNGLSRGQNFIKVEKWLREASTHDLIIITPGVIANIENDDTRPVKEFCEPPSELDRLPPMMPAAQSQLTLQS